MVFENAIENLSVEALEGLKEDALKRANDAMVLEQTNKYITDQLPLVEICERELLKRKLSAQK